MQHEQSAGMLDKTPPTVVAFLEISEGSVREIPRFETVGLCSSTCSRRKIETYPFSFQLCRNVGGGTSLV